MRTAQLALMVRLVGFAACCLLVGVFMHASKRIYIAFLLQAALCLCTGPREHCMAAEPASTTDVQQVEAPETAAVSRPKSIETGNSPEPNRLYADMQKRVEELSSSVAALNVKLSELDPARQPGKVEELERKAFEHDALQVKLQLRDKTIAGLKTELANAREFAVANEKKIRYLNTVTNELAAIVDRTEEKQKSLKQALDLVRLGKFEYYQVKEGDTCESIAAQQMIYNDKSKHILIRQANRGSVENLDKLIPGETLIIPRVSLRANYEF